MSQPAPGKPERLYSFQESLHLLEQSVLSLVLQGGQEEWIESLSSDAFNDARHRTVFETAKDLARLKIPVDLISVTDRLRATEQLLAVDVRYLTDLTGLEPAIPSMLGSLIALLRRQAAARALVQLGQTLYHGARQENPPVEELCTLAVNMVETIRKDLPDRALAMRRIYETRGAYGTGNPASRRGRPRRVP